MLSKDDETGEMNEMGKMKNKGILEMKTVHEEFTRKIARSRKKSIEIENTVAKITKNGTQCWEES